MFDEHVLVAAHQCRYFQLMLFCRIHRQQLSFSNKCLKKLCYYHFRDADMVVNVLLSRWNRIELVFPTWCILIVQQRLQNSNSDCKKYEYAGFHGSRTRKSWHHTYILHVYYISIADLMVFVMWSSNSRKPLHASVLKLSDHTLMYNYGMFHVWYGLTLLGSCLTWIPSHCTLCGDTISQSYVITTMVPSKPALMKRLLEAASYRRLAGDTNPSPTYTNNCN